MFWTIPALPLIPPHLGSRSCLEHLRRKQNHIEWTRRCYKHMKCKVAGSEPSTIHRALNANRSISMEMKANHSLQLHLATFQHFSQHWFIIRGRTRNVREVYAVRTRNVRGAYASVCGTSAERTRVYAERPRSVRECTRNVRGAYAECTRSVRGTYAKRIRVYAERLQKVWQHFVIIFEKSSNRYSTMWFAFISSEIERFALIII